MTHAPPFGTAWQGAPLAEGSRIWVLGAGGQVGQACVQGLQDHFEVRGFLHQEWDITRPEAVQAQLYDRLPEQRPDVLINCAALTHVDRCETDPDAAFRVNAHGPGMLAHACERTGIVFVHFSSDYVFDGRQRRPWQETDPPQPINQYGRSKLAAEQEILRQMPSGRFLIVRTSWVFAPYGRNFVTYVLHQCRSGQPLRAVTDQIGGPTSAPDLVAALRLLLHRGQRGWIHFRNENPTSRYEQARTVARLFGLDEGLIQPVSSRDLSWVAARPRYSVLAVDRYTALAGQPPRPWQEALQDLRDALFSAG